MILVVGGVASGKRTYVESLGFGSAEVVFDVHELVRGGAGAAGGACGGEVVAGDLGGHDGGAAGIDIRALADELARKRAVICAEVGSGIVPLDAGERAWRERVGELTQLLAARADSVVRMVCGIPVVLKAGGADAAPGKDTAFGAATGVAASDTDAERGSAPGMAVSGADGEPGTAPETMEGGSRA